MKEIIKFAEARGYKGHLKYLPLILPRVHLDPYFLLDSRESDIFFDHDFLNAVFGEEIHETYEAEYKGTMCWQHHARELSLILPDKRKEYIHNYIRSQTHDEADEKRKDS